MYKKKDPLYIQELQTQYNRFFESATDEEVMAFGDCENLSDEMRFRIIDMLEELDCIDLLDEFLIKYRRNPALKKPTYI